MIRRRIPHPVARLCRLLLVLALAGGCSAAMLPSREGSTSDQVVWAYFSQEPAGTSFSQRTMNVSGRTLYGPAREEISLPPRASEFDPSRDPVIWFFVTVKGPKGFERESFEISGELVAPTGDRGRFNRTIESKAMRHGTDEIKYWTTWPFNARAMAAFPGVWTAFLAVDGEPVGVYRFLLGDAATIATLKEGMKRSAEIAAQFAGPSVRLELSGPARARVTITQHGNPVTTGAFDNFGKALFSLPPGTYDVEVTHEGSGPWRDAITLNAGEPRVSRTVTLPRQ